MKQQHYIIIIIILVILNVFSWRMWWDKPNIEEKFKERVEMFKEQAPREEQGLRYLIRELDLSEQQKQEFHKLRIVHFKKVKEKEAELELMRKEVMGHLAIGDTIIEDETLFKNMAEKKVEIEEAMYQHLATMRALCSQEQQVKFDTLFHRMMYREAKDGDKYRNRQRNKNSNKKRDKQDSNSEQ